MNFYISGSNRKENCYKVLQDLMKEDDKIVSLANKNIKYCIGCNACQEKERCILKDDMEEIYINIEKADSIIIATPIYFNHITGILKNVIDRWNPFTVTEALKGKTIYLITIGAMPETENKSVAENISNYFEEVCDIFECNYKFLRNFTTEEGDDVIRNYDNYKDIIKELKNKIDKTKKTTN